MKTALIVGSSGLVGSYLLRFLLENKYYQQVKILVRKPVDLHHPSLVQVIFNFENPDYSQIIADDIYCCLGTTIKKAGSQSAFRRVDFEYPLDIANSAIKNGAKNFAIVTAMGSNPKSRIFYNRVKGEVEQELEKLPFEKLLILRPSLLLGPRNESRMGETIGKVVMTAFSLLLPNKIKAIHASQVARCMIENMQNNVKEIKIIDSGFMQNFPVVK